MNESRNEDQKNPQDNQNPAQHDLQAASVSLPGELVYAAKVGTGMELRLYRDGPGHGRAQWMSVENGTVLAEEGVRLRLGWEENWNETDPSHWMAGFVDARTPDAPMSWVSRPIPVEVMRRMATVEASVSEAF